MKVGIIGTGLSGSPAALTIDLSGSAGRVVLDALQKQS